jgi:hypothetical protein
MTELSPAAQAVDAALAACIQLQGEIIRARPLAAAALEAVTDQVVPPAVILEYYERNESPVLGKAIEVRNNLLAIAAELRGQDQPSSEEP